jgi:hypothetical protein
MVLPLITGRMEVADSVNPQWCGKSMTPTWETPKLAV